MKLISSRVITAFVVFFLIACGEVKNSGGDTNPVENGASDENITSAENNASAENNELIDVFKKYADGSANKPNLSDFEALTVSGVTAKNVNIINNYIKTKSSQDVDSKDKIQNLVYNCTIQIFTIGDSTVFNRYDGENLMGWGNQKALGSYMKNPDNLHNYARSGASSKSYQREEPKAGEYHFEKTKTSIKDSINDDKATNGAYLLIQFGHNDEVDEEKGTTVSEFAVNLQKYINWASGHNVIPVLITPVERRDKVSGKDNRETHKFQNGDDYAKTVREVAHNNSIRILDLQKKSWDEYNQYKNTEELNQIFSEHRRDDKTHFSPKGAKIIGRLVKELICEKDKKLCSLFK